MSETDAEPLTAEGRARLLDPQTWRPILEKYARAADLAVALADPEGRLIGECINPRQTWSLLRRTLPANNPGCPFSLWRDEPCDCVTQALERNGPVLVRRPVGLVHFAVPLQLDGAALGALVGGQRFERFPENLTLEKVARQFGVPAWELWQVARREQPVKFQTLRIYADLLADLGRTVLQERRLLLTERERLAEMVRLRGLLEQRNQELTDRDRRKDHFLATLGHELRNPLTPIRNAVQLLKLWDVPDADVQWAIGLIGRQVVQLTRLVDDLLDVSRLAQNKVELRLQRVDAAAVVAGAVEGTRPLLDAHSHELTTVLPEQPVHLWGDPDRLTQVFTNLLTNAAKYTPPGGHIVVEVSQDDRDAMFRVRDDGVGIAPEMLPRVFQLFVQAENANLQAPGGLGIGLSLVRSLVQLHGGDVQIASEGAGKGCEVTVRLPVSPIQPAAALGVSTEASPAAAPIHRVLVADDQCDTVESLAILMHLWQYEVQTATDGSSALELAQRCLPDAAVLDISLPGMNGYELARQLRRLPGGDRILLVAMTGYASADDQQRVRDAGFDVHLIKPIDLEKLRGVLEGSHAEAALVSAF